jgi:hypothetical protein
MPSFSSLAYAGRHWANQDKGMQLFLQPFFSPFFSHQSHQFQGEEKAAFQGQISGGEDGRFLRRRERQCFCVFFKLSDVPDSDLLKERHVSSGLGSRGEEAELTGAGKHFFYIIEWKKKG